MKEVYPHCNAKKLEYFKLKLPMCVTVRVGHVVSACVCV